MANDATMRIGMDSRAVDIGIAKMKGGLLSLGKAGASLGRDLAGIGISMLTVDMAKAAVEAANLMTSFQGLMKQSMGSAQLAYNEINALRELAKDPGLDFATAVRGSARLQSLGISALGARKMLSELGNVSALDGMNAEDFSQIVDALVDIGAAGSITDEKIDRLTERSATFARVMKDTFGASTAEQLRELGVSADEFLEKLPEGLSKLDRASGGTANEIKNTKDEIFQLAAEFGEFLLPTVDVGLKVIEVTMKVIRDVFSEVETAFGAMAAWFGGVELSEARKISREVAHQRKQQAEQEKQVHDEQLKILDAKADEERIQKRILDGMKRTKEEMAKGLKNARELNDHESEMKILQARILGNESLAQQLERELDLRQRIRGLSENQLLNERQRFDLAYQEVDLRAKLESKNKTDEDTNKLRDFEAEHELLKARAEGNEQLIAKLEREAKVKRVIAELEGNSLITDEKRVALAEERVDLEEQAQRVKSLKESAQSWAIMQMELKILSERVKGNEIIADHMQKQLDIAKEMLQLAGLQGVSDADKAKHAKETVEAREKMIKNNKDLDRYMEDTEIMRLRNRGKNRQADELELRRRIKDDVDAMAPSSSKSREELEKVVRERIKQEERQGKGGKIKGYRQEDNKYINPNRNLDEYYKGGKSEYEKNKDRTSAFDALKKAKEADDAARMPQSKQASANAEEKAASTDPAIPILTDMSSNLKIIATAAQ